MIRKLTSLLLALVLVLSMSGCAGLGGSNRTAEQDKQKLYDVLDEIAGKIDPDSDSGLNTLRIAAHLVLWASSTNMTKKEAANALSQWVKELPQEKKDSFKKQMAQVAEAYGEAAVDGARSILESVDVQGSIGEWSDELKDLVDALLEEAKS